MPARQTQVLTANVVATFTLDTPPPPHRAFSGVRVKTNGAAEASYVVSTTGTLGDPAFRADDTYFLPATAAVDYPESHQSRFERAVVKVVSPGTPTICVEGF